MESFHFMDTSSSQEPVGAFGSACGSDVWVGNPLTESPSVGLIPTFTSYLRLQNRVRM